MQKICLVIGAGAGIGGNTAHRFASEGYHIALCRRSNKDGLDAMVKSIENKGGSASGYILNAVKEDSIEDVINEIESGSGPIAFSDIESLCDSLAISLTEMESIFKPNSFFR